MAAGAPDDQQSIVDMLIQNATTRVEGQRRDAGDIDAKTLGILAFTVGVIAILITVAPSLGPAWAPIGVFVGMGGAFMVDAIRPRDFDSGPDINTFYETMISKSRLEASVQMLSQLRRAVDDNIAIAKVKNAQFQSGVALLFIGLILAAAIAVLESLD